MRRRAHGASLLRLPVATEERMKRSFIVLAALVAVSACTAVGPVTAEERARCEAMRAQMGTQPRHSHEEVKGTVAQSPMNREHQRCRATLQQG